MPTQRAKFAVGLFVTSGIVIVVLAVVWLGMSRFLQKGQYYVTYFNESVQGLDKDSPVKYRGVPVGRVERISVAPDEKLIQVVLKIESGQELNSHVVAQLKSVGITGSMFVELDRKNDGELDRSPVPSFPSEYPIVASKPSDIKELLRGLDNFLNQAKALDVKTISKKIKLTLDNINQKVADAQVKDISISIGRSLERMNQILGDERWEKIMASVEEAGQSLNGVMDKADKSLTRVEGIVAEKEDEIKAAIEGFRQAMENVNIFLEKGSSLVSETDDSISYLRPHMMVIAQNLEKASENLDRLTELLAEQPSQLIFSEPPVPRKVERKVRKGDGGL
jgi:phospholipid/cholesterol/gamma-HCH transport system substrate-binding protein